MREISAPLRIAAGVLRQDEGWLTFVEIPISAGTVRLVQSERNTLANGFAWQACSLGVEFPTEEASGSLGRMVLVVPNISRIPMAYVEVDDELLGASVTVYKAHESSLAVFEPALSWSHTIIDCEMTEGVARFNCAHSAELFRAPGPLFDRTDFPQLLRSGGVTR